MNNNNPLDEIVLVMVAMLGIPVVVAGLLTTVNETSKQWLLENGLVVKAKQAAVELPGGVGLDNGRIAVLAGVVLLLLAVGIYGATRLVNKDT